MEENGPPSSQNALRGASFALLSAGHLTTLLANVQKALLNLGGQTLHCFHHNMYLCAHQTASLDLYHGATHSCVCLVYFVCCLARSSQVPFFCATLFRCDQRKQGLSTSNNSQVNEAILM